MPAHHATTTHPSRLSLTGDPSAALWWPQDRRLARQLPVLDGLWPAARGRIVRVVYDPADWEDRPRRVAIDVDRSVRTDPFQDHRSPRPCATSLGRLEVVTDQGRHHPLALIPADTEEVTARALLAHPVDRVDHVRDHPRDLAGLLAQVAHERRAVGLLRSSVRSRETDAELAAARRRLVTALQQVCDELTRTGRPVSPRLLSELRLYRGLGSR